MFSFVFSSLFLVAANAADLKSKIYFSVSEHSSLACGSSAAFLFVLETAASRAEESALPASGFRQNGQTETARAVSFSAFCLTLTSSLVRVTIFIRRIVFIVSSCALSASCCPLSCRAPSGGKRVVIRKLNFSAIFGERLAFLRQFVLAKRRRNGRVGRNAELHGVELPV